MSQFQIRCDVILVVSSAMSTEQIPEGMRDKPLEYRIYYKKDEGQEVLFHTAPNKRLGDEIEVPFHSQCNIGTYKFRAEIHFTNSQGQPCVSKTNLPDFKVRMFQVS